MELHILNDPDLCFKDIMKRHLNGEQLLDEKAQAEWETTAEDEKDTSKLNGEVVIEKSPKKSENEDDSKATEEEAKDEKKAVAENGKEDASSPEKKDSTEDKSDEKSENKSDEKSQDKTDEKSEEKPEQEDASEEDDKKESKDETESEEKMEVDEDSSKKDQKNGDETADKDDEKEESKVNGEKEDSDEKKEGVTKEEEEEDTKPSVSVTITPAKPAADKKKARLPPPAITSIVAPNFTMQQIEQMAKGGAGAYDIEAMSIDLMAQTYAAAIRWPKDRVLTARLEQVIACVDSGEWNVPEDFSLANELLESPQTETPPVRDTSTPMSDSGSVSEASLVNDGDLVVSAVGRKGRGRGRAGQVGLDPAAAAELEKSSKIRSLLTAGNKDDLR